MPRIALLGPDLAYLEPAPPCEWRTPLRVGGPSKVVCYKVTLVCYKVTHVCYKISPRFKSGDTDAGAGGG